MLVAAFILTILSLAIAKCVIIFGATHEDCYLRRIAVMQCLQEKPKKSDCCNAQLFKRKCKQFLTECPDEYRRNVLCRKTSLTLSVVIITTNLILGGLFYDLHLLSCILEPSEEFIEYNTTTQTVELRYSDNLSRSQKVVGAISLFLGIAFLLNCFMFYYCTFWVVNGWKQKLTEELKKKLSA